MQAVVRVASKGVPIYAQTAFNLILRCATAYGLRLDRSNVMYFEARLSERIQWESGYLNDLVQISAPFRNSVPANLLASIMSDLNKVTSLELQRISGELNLTAASNARVADVPAPNTHVIVNAPVGVLQTGAGSYGVASFTIDSSAADALGKAFEDIQGQLSVLSDKDVGFNRQEILDMVMEAQAETKKERPNSTKLKAFVTGVGSAISFTPKLKAASDTLKWAGALVSIPLP
ncbi:hypothetical protein [Mesorhizobium sp. NPDC059025]|uniref:hypothetical protein n=1 Tax=unclassified Mesorhizobium TaxID=325217 RepID=UPI0036CCB408